MQLEPNLFRSLRVRLSLGFALAMLPVIGLAAYALGKFLIESSDNDTRRALRQLLDAARPIMDQPNWHDEIGKLVEQKDYADKHLSLLVYGGRPGKPELVYKSSDKVPSTQEIAVRMGVGHFAPNAKPAWRIIPQRTGRYLLLAARPQPEIDREHNLQTLEFSVLSILALLVTASGTWIAVSRTLKPIQSLSEQAETAATDSLAVRLDPPSEDIEIVQLVQTLNGMLRRLSESVESKGRFYAAASHELRTPLMALSGNLELALSRERSADEYRELIKEAKAQTERLTQLTQGLLLLHQLESSKSSELEAVEVDLALQEGVKTMQRLHEEVQFELEQVVPLEVKAMPSHAQILVRNLLENAAKYSTDKRVHVSLKDRSLEVSNSAEALPDEFFAHIGEPLLRESFSRVRTKGGNGLGLSICVGIAKANGWEISFAQENGLFKALVQFPLASKPRHKLKSA